MKGNRNVSIKNGGKGGRHFTYKIIRYILHRDDYTCIYCGDIAEQIDHVVPRSKGGYTSKENGVASCRKCNCKKKDGFEEYFIVKGITHLARKGENMAWLDNFV